MCQNLGVFKIVLYTTQTGKQGKEVPKQQKKCQEMITQLKRPVSSLVFARWLHLQHIHFGSHLVLAVFVGFQVYLVFGSCSG